MITKAMLEEVKDEESFTKFLVALMKDWETGYEGWENSNIGSFLEAAAAWAESTKDGVNDYSPPPNPWRRCAEILHAGKVYE